MVAVRFRSTDYFSSRATGALAVAAVLIMLSRYNFWGPIAATVSGHGPEGTARAWLSAGLTDTPVAGLNLSREGYYKLVADELAPIVSPRTVILASEFGAMGYFSDASFISSIGHVSPEVLRYLPPRKEDLAEPSSNHSIPVSMVQGLRPDYVVSLEIFIRRTLLESSWFKNEYRLWKRYPGATGFGSKGLYVFQRKDLTDSSPHAAS